MIHRAEETSRFQCREHVGEIVSSVCNLGVIRTVSWVPIGGEPVCARMDAYRQENEVQCLGIDVSKDKFDVALLVDEANLDKFKQKVFSNDSDGFLRLIAWLKTRAPEPAHVCMEATNTYWESLAEFLSDQGFLVSVINPSLIKKESQSWGTRNKTDKADARVIARYCAAKRPQAWVAPSVEARELRDLVRHLSCLQEERQRHRNRLETASSEAVRSSLKQLIVFLDEKISELEKGIGDHINRHPGLKSDADLLRSIPGLGDKTIAVILSELPDVSNFRSAKSVAAYGGLSPRRIESGSYKGATRLCKFGNAQLRRALYFPAVVAIRYNPLVRDFYIRLRRNGKCKMSAIGACMRKLLTIVYGVLRTGAPFRAPA
jgi:transposase